MASSRLLLSFVPSCAFLCFGCGLSLDFIGPAPNTTADSGIDAEVGDGSVPDAAVTDVTTPDGPSDGGVADGCIAEELCDGINNDCDNSIDEDTLCNGVCFNGVCKLQLKEVSAGGGHSCGIDLDDRAVCWGKNHRGQIGNGEMDLISDPDYVISNGGPLSLDLIAAGSDFTCGALGGEVFCWGENNRGQLGSRIGFGALNPMRVPGLPTDGIETLVSGFEHSCALSNGRLYCWGSNVAGQIPNPDGNATLMPVRLVSETGQPFRLASTGAGQTCAVRDERGLECWGVPARHMGPSRLATIEAVASGRRHNCIQVSTNRSVLCWGDNDHGQLGRMSGPGGPSLGLVPVDGAPQALAIEAGGDHTCLLTPSEELYCWGDNRAGQVTPESLAANFSSPVRVTPFGIRRFAAVSAGHDHTCAIATEDRTVVCWGNSNDGRLGGPGQGMFVQVEGPQDVP
ncbi:MAG: hypothetical protein AAGF12_20305 [Myxococcota bacterium]